MVDVLVKAAAERPRVIRRRAHTSPLWSARLPDHLLAARRIDSGYSAVGGDRTVKGETYRGD